MNLLTEVINLLRDSARAAGCDGVVMRAEITLTVSGVLVVMVVPISVPTMPNDPSSATRPTEDSK